uniref:SRCR domain-containing protein n=1 Tax=Taeniopygia guttata TaxID=59729 RepID=A0A674H100_TAEGU
RGAGTWQRRRGPRRWRARLSSPRAAGSGQLRLVGGGGRCAGRVEVEHGGEWGSVCVYDFDWEPRWAAVVCRLLGCGRVARASPYVRFGQGTGRIWMQPFCRGGESALEECTLCWSILGRSEPCRCPCADAVELRLAGGSSPCAGRVEVKLQGQWGTVGDDVWDMEDAEVVCRQLGCGSASGPTLPMTRSVKGMGSSAWPGWTAVGTRPCSGTVRSVTGDPINSSTITGTQLLSAKVGAGLMGARGTACASLDTGPAGLSRLVGGDGACAGRLEVRRGQAWVGVCEDQVDMKVAQVVCRELGCGEALAIPGSARFGRGSGSLWDGGFQCNGTESLLSACARRLPHSQACAGPASVICSAYTGFRLGNSSSGCSGRVEVAVRGTWGSVCASEWDLADAHVLCRHLGCGRASSVPPGGSFGSGEGTLRPDAFGCHGSERHPGECPVAVLGKPPCVPGNAAAVNCSVESLRLVGGESRCDGFLDLAIATGAWRRVPGEVSLVRNFNEVCWELGCGELDRTDAVRGTIKLQDVNKNERSIIQRAIRTIMDKTTRLARRTINDYYILNREDFITTAPADIPHGNYITCSGGCPEKGQRCGCPKQPPQPIPSLPTGSRQVRLAGSSGCCAGRVEVYSGGSWSSVCQEGWELQDTAVVCRELGCGTALEAPSRARFGAGTGPLWPYVPDCSGSEESLWECRRTERRECGRGGGAGAVCSEQLSVRLAGGPGRCRGYLEVSYNGTWGRVCANGTRTGTGTAVCRQLGCGHRGWLSAVPTQQPSLAWLAWVGCEDGARSLWGAPRPPGTCRAGHRRATPKWSVRRTAMAPLRDALPHIRRVPPAQVALPVPASPRRLAGIPLPSLPACVPTGVPSRSPSAVAVGTVPVPTVLCVVLGTLLCLSLGALALLLCRARARRRGGSRWMGVGTDPVWGSCGTALKVAGVIRVPPTGPRAPGKCCIWFQALAELQMPSPTLSTRSWITKPCQSTRRCPLPQVGAALVPRLCSE